jgi:hypothetical protein
MFGGPAIRSFRLTGYTEAMGMAFDVALEYGVPSSAPSHLMVAIRDLADQTPVYLAAGGKVLLYDAAKQRIIIGTPPGISFVAKNEPGKGLLLLASFNEDATSTVEVDVPSILSNFHLFEAAPVTNDGYTLTGTSDGGSKLRATVDLRKQCPYSKLDIIASDGHTVLLRFEKIEADAPIPAHLWNFPSASSLKRGLSVTEFDEWWKDRATDDSPFHAIAYRAALRDKALRPAWEERYGKVNWDDAEKADAAMSAAIREFAQQARTDAPPGER